MSEPIPMLLHCPLCNERHIDAGEFTTKAHHTHACQSCGHCWRPAVVNTVGVQFLPGFKDESEETVVSVKVVPLGERICSLCEVEYTSSMHICQRSMCEYPGCSEATNYELDGKALCYSHWLILNKNIG